MLVAMIPLALGLHGQFPSDVPNVSRRFISGSRQSTERAQRRFCNLLDGIIWMQFRWAGAFRSCQRRVDLLAVAYLRRRALDAIDPNDLRAIVQTAVEQHLPPEHFEILKAAENSERESLQSWFTEWRHMDDTRSQEDRARRAAKRIGLKARRSRWRAGSIDNLGDFQIIDPQQNWVIAEENRPHRGRCRGILRRGGR